MPRLTRGTYFNKFGRASLIDGGGTSSKAVDRSNINKRALMNTWPACILVRKESCPPADMIAN